MECGSKLELRCPQCSTPYNDGQKFCMECGTPLGATPAAPLPTKPRVPNSALPEERRNHIWATFHDPRRRRLFTDWEAGARSSVARFRADSARHVGDGDFEDLIGEMRRTSPEFDAWWSRHEVAPSGQGRKVLRHPTAGTLHFEHAVFKLEETPEQRLILYTALPTAGTPEKLARLMTDAGR